MAKRKTLVIHIRPHIDDTTGVWLFMRYDRRFKDAQIKFLPLDIHGGKTYGGAPVDSDPSIVHVGMARGTFDEHSAHSDDTAATLVWKHLTKTGKAPRDRFERLAVEKILAYVQMEDKGRLRANPLRDFTIDALIHEGIGGRVGDAQKLSRKMFALGTELLDILIETQENRARLEADFKNGTPFMSKWGKAIALKTKYNRVDDVAFQEGYVLVVHEDPTTGYRQFRARAGSRVSLASTHRTLMQIDPEAEWYLHQSNKLIISGARIAPNVKLSKLPLKELINLVKK